VTSGPERVGGTDYVAAVGALTVLGGLTALAIGPRMAGDRPASPRRKPRWETVVRMILIIHVIVMVGWVVNFAMFTMLAGLIGFQDFWTVPVGVTIVITLVVAGVTYAPGSSSGRIIAAAGLAGSASALLYSLQFAEFLVSQVVIVVLVALAVAGIVVVILENHLTTPRAESVH
jgi:hypothetical protein